ncbi:hypothetical protein MVES_003703 [Malassezia vespertilionis]|uniref:Macro domain-containing protein n=1 Tax=Malassezia vespertilionis TaxID=2020962 RepID=A0A2N1J790_9BASI|nr:hypothetical protein MVES_003703 [Malassezia vespertilionis]
MRALAEKIALVRADITKLDVDAIVNAATNSLLGGGGVDGAIHRAANDPRFLQECRAHRWCATGEAKTTQAYQLPCKAVVHTVGYVFRQLTQPDLCVWRKAAHADANHTRSVSRKLLQDAYRNSLYQAAEHQCRSIVRRQWLTEAFPAISTGV